MFIKYNAMMDISILVLLKKSIIYDTKKKGISGQNYELESDGQKIVSKGSNV